MTLRVRYNPHMAEDFLEMCIYPSTGKVGWQWRNGRCTKNGCTYEGVEKALEMAWAAYTIFQEENPS